MSLDKKTIIYSFLNITDLESQIGNMKVWLCLYAVFTLLFMDIGVYINFVYLTNKNSLLIYPLFFTISVVAAFISYLKLRSKVLKKPSISFIYQAIVQAFMAIMFFCLSGLFIIQREIGFSLVHGIIILLGIIANLAMLIYRQRLYKSGKQKEIKPAFYAGTIPLTLILIPFFKKYMEQFDQMAALTVGFMFLAFILLLCFFGNFHNYYVAKKNNIDDEFS